MPKSIKTANLFLALIEHPYDNQRTLIAKTDSKHGWQNGANSFLIRSDQTKKCKSRY